jgi:tRNA A-37 threonylcarbamoyl transferase component Bud32
MDSLPDDRHLEPGTRFNNYQVERLLGHGGMGAAFLARDLVLGRPVVVKVMLGDAADDPTLLERFRREAQAGALIDSENVVKVYKAGRISGAPTLTIQGKPFIALQYVDGGTVSDLARSQGRLPADLVAAMMLGLARALVATHAAGIVHRDVKPSNVLLTRDGRLKLADLGLAKFLRGINGGPPPPDLTRPGRAVGTAAYMAPEQARGGAVDGRADVYALGVTFYELLTDTLPFVGSSDLETMALRLRESPRPLREVVPDLAPEYEGICLAFMERDPTRRPDAADAVRLLERLVPGDRSQGLAGLFADPKASKHLELVATVARRYGLVRESSRVLPDGIDEIETAPGAPEGRVLPAALFALGAFFLATAAIAVALIVVHGRPQAVSAPPVAVAPLVPPPDPAPRTASATVKAAIASRRASKVRAAADTLRATPSLGATGPLIEAAGDAALLLGAFETRTRGLEPTLALDELFDALLVDAASKTSGAVDDDVKAAATLLAAVEGRTVPGELYLPADARGGAADKLAHALGVLELERPSQR